MAFLRDHLHRRLDIRTIAEACQISESHLLHGFSQAGLSSPMRMLWQLRIDQAARMLLQTDLPIGAIGEQCGFASQAHFSRRFKERMGMSPKDYRRLRPDLGRFFAEEDG